MNDEQTTLKQVLMPDEPGVLGVPASLWAAIAASAALIALQATVVAQCGAGAWAGALRGIQEAVAGVFDTPVRDLLAGAWNQQRDLAKSLTESRAKPEEIILLPLLEHRVQSVHHPYVEVSVAGARQRLTFDLTAALDVQGAMLMLQAGRIRAVESGTCRGSVKLALGDVVLAEKQTGSIRLPGSVNVLTEDAS